MTEAIVIVGCGGFGREVHDVIDAINAIEPTWHLIGYVDDDPSEENRLLVTRRGSRVLGPLAQLHAMEPGHAVIGIGAGAVRRTIDGKLEDWGWRSATLIHPDATLGAQVHVGDGAVVCAGSRLTNNIRIGRHVHINLNTTVGHDCTLHDYVTVNPLVAISGGVEVGPDAMLGTHSAVLQNLTIGASAIVGAGSCVVSSVPADTTVKGVPAR